MKEYNIYCTKKQTLQALRLGMPIRQVSESTPVDIPTVAANRHASMLEKPTIYQMGVWLFNDKNINVYTVMDLDIKFRPVVSLYEYAGYEYQETKAIDLGDPLNASPFENKADAMRYGFDIALNYLEQHKDNK